MSMGSPEAGPFGGVAARLSIFIRETDDYHHKPLYAEIVHQAHKAGLAGASVFRGILGFSAPDYPKSRHPLLGQDVPVVIEIVDREDRIRAFIPTLKELMDGGLAGLAILEPAEVIGLSGAEDGARS